ncbi:hypothetical protein M011DRAFT_472837 [Sporormia fimetaria CBS 119925]|uniref:Uncharacterized protein n=1 Tax=Sporormia fimetaria CBS 119925 TaxID=1340428 RepID=A0A6A6UUD4_9PLEO|nr:hypothetical protein M011DRAFT_472837 [Sporormia fimetaria CBS 119925]
MELPTFSINLPEIGMPSGVSEAFGELKSQRSTSLSGEAVAGIVIGAVLLVGLLAAFIYCVKTKRSKSVSTTSTHVTTI